MMDSKTKTSSPTKNSDEGAKRPVLIRAIAGAMAGSIAEWYDFYLFATATSLVFSTEFFRQSGNVWNAIISAFALYGVGFLARPFGAIVFGRIGDSRGRVHALMISLSVVGISTLAMAFLPTFRQVGILAPILLVLVRLVQGFGFGGEWGGGTLIVSENSPRNRRGYWSGWPQTGVPGGNILATLVLLLLSSVLSKQDFLAWGWRIAFGLSFIVILVGLWVRSKVEDAPIFKRAKEEAEKQQYARPTASEIISNHWRHMLVGLGARFAENILYYIAVTFMLTYLQVVVKVKLKNILAIMLAAAAIHFLMLPLAGLASDHFGRRPVFIVGSALTAVWSLWAFPLMHTGRPIAVLFAVGSAMVIDAMLASPYPSLMTELFPTRVRATCLSVCYQIAPIFAGGFAPLIASALLRKYNSWIPIALYLLVASIITLISILSIHETSGSRLEDVDESQKSASMIEGVI